MYRNLLLATAVVALNASTAASAADWRWSVTPYAWATDVGLDVKVADRQLIDETISIEDLIEDLDTIAQVRVEAQAGAHGIFVDLFDVNLSDDPQTVALPAGHGSATFEPTMGMTILDLGGIYLPNGDPKGDQQGFALLYGARLLNQRATIDATVQAANGATTRRELEVDDRLADALFGIRYRRTFGERWSFQTAADVSTGGTELTWSAGPSLGYSFGAHRQYTATLGYRRMVVDFDSEDDVDATMTLSGFVTGLRIAF